MLLILFLIVHEGGYKEGDQREDLDVDSSTSWGKSEDLLLILAHSVDTNK